MSVYVCVCVCVCVCMYMSLTNKKVDFMSVNKKKIKNNNNKQTNKQTKEIYTDRA